MYLYKENNKVISVYSFTPDSAKLIEYKKRFLSDIKSVILHINNPETKELVFKSPTVAFRALDRIENNQKTTYIEETKNANMISQYINGQFDSLDPVSIIGSPNFRKSRHSGELFDEDSTLLFRGGHECNSEYLTDEGILLTGWLDIVQPLLSNDVNNLIFPDFLNYEDDELSEFLQLFSCIREKNISLSQLEFLRENGLIKFTSDYYDTFIKSNEVLSIYNEVQKRTRKR